MKDYIDGKVTKEELEKIIYPNKEYIVFPKEAYYETERCNKKLITNGFLIGFFSGLIVGIGFVLLLQ